MTNNLEVTTGVSKTGGSEEASVETALDEQSMKVSRDDGTVVQEENDETEVETLNEEYPLKENEYNQTDGGVVGEEGENSGEERNEEDAIGNGEDNDLQNGENLREKNEGGAKLLNVGYLLKEDGYNRTDAVVGGEDENSRIDKSEDNNEENVQNMEEENEGGAAGVDKNNKGDIMEEDNDQENGQNTEEKNEGGTAGVDKDNKRDTLGKDEYEGKEEEKNVEKLEAISNQTTKKYKKGNTRKRKADKNSEAKGEKKQVLKKVASEGKGKEYCGNLGSRDDNDQDSKGTEMGNLVYSCDDDGRFKKVDSGDEAKMSPEKMASEGRDSPELSEKKKKSFEQVDSMGMIFMCNSKTKKDCYRYKVLGLPANKREMVEKVYKGMKVFLYDVDLKLMYGIYKAAGHGGFSIEPKAFKSQFPSQVRFSIVDDCLPLAEEKFREVIKKNYYTKTKFDCKLTSDQVKNLCKLFISASKESCVQLKSETSMDRQSQPEHVRQTKWVEEPRYHGHPHLHGRDVVTSPAVPLAWPQNSLPLAAGQSHNRALEIGVYGWDTVTHNRDTCREGRLVEPHDFYSRDKLLKHPDNYRGEALAEHCDYSRPDGIVEGREYQLVNLETGRQDVVNHYPYASYSEHFSSQDPVYPPGRRPEYNPPPGLRPEYHLGGLSSEYISTRGIPPEYHSSSNSLPEFHYHQPVYRY